MNRGEIWMSEITHERDEEHKKKNDNEEEEEEHEFIERVNM